MSDKTATITLTRQEAAAIRLLAKAEYGATLLEQRRPNAPYPDGYLTDRLEMLDSIIAKVKDIR